MKKLTMLLLALSLVAGIAVAAYAEVQNVKVSGDITVQAVARDRLMLNKYGDRNFNTGTRAIDYSTKVNGVLSHVRVKIDADLTDNVSTTVRLLNERVWGVEGGTDTNIDIDLAYATMKEFLYSPLTLTIGRQELHFGNDLVIGDPDTNNLMAGHNALAGSTFLPNSLDDLSLRKSFDAIRATLNYNPLTVDVVASKITEGAIDANTDTNLYGVNANYAVNKELTAEMYYWHKDNVHAVSAAGSTTRSDWTGTVGSRVNYTGIKNLVVGLEGAYQIGRHGTNNAMYADDPDALQKSRRRSAYAVQFVSQYNLKDIITKYEPMVKANYTLLSGDSRRSSNHVDTGWDPMYENQSGGTLYNKILGYSNCHLVTVGASAKPTQDVKVGIDYTHIWLQRTLRDSSALNMVTLTGVVGDPTYMMKTNKADLAGEVDANITYDYTEDVQFGLNAGWFIPGGAFDGNNDLTASQLIGSMKVTF